MKIPKISYPSKVLKAAISAAVLVAPGALWAQHDPTGVYSYNNQSEDLNPNREHYYPANLVQLEDAIAGAVAAGKTIKVAGTQHATSSLILSDSALYLHTSNLNKIGPIEHENGEAFVRVQAGVTLRQISNYLAERGYSLGYAYPQFGGLSVAGPIATGSHGSSRTHDAVASQMVKELTLVTVDAGKRVKTMHLSRERDGDLFKAANVSVGAAGIVFDVKIKVVPQFNIEMRTEVTSAADLFAKPGKIDWNPSESYRGKEDTLIVAWFPNTEKVVRMIGYQADKPAMPGAEFIPFGKDFSITTANYATAAAFAKGREDAKFNAMIEAKRVERFEAEPQFVVEMNGRDVNSNRVIGPSHKMLLGRGDVQRLAYIARDYSFSFPDSEAAEVLQTIREFAKTHNYSFPLTGIYFRFGKSDSNSNFLSHAERPGVKQQLVVFAQFIEYKPWKEAGPLIPNEQDRLRNQLFELLLKKHAVRFHWGKNSDEVFAMQAAVLGADENMVRFRNAANVLDPNKIFRTAFLDKMLFGVETKTSCEAGLKPHVPKK